MVHQRVRGVIRRARVRARLRQARSRARAVKIGGGVKRQIFKQARKIKSVPLRRVAKTGAGLALTAVPVGRVGVGAAQVGRAAVARGGVVGLVGGTIRGVGAKLEQFGKPVTLKAGAGRVGSRLAKGLGIVTGVEFIKSGITGEPFNPFTRGAAFGAAGFAVGGVPALVAGSILGGGKKTISTAIELGGTVGAALPDIPFIPSFPSPQPSNTVNIDFGDAPSLQTPLPPVGSVTPAGATFSADIGGGGGGDLSGLLLLLLLGIGGGALGGAILEKRKKKKRKKLKGKLRKLDE